MGWEPLPRRYDREPQPLRDGLDRVARSLGVPSADTLDAIFRQWPDLVGAAVAAHSRPLRIRDGELLVAVDDPAWATQLRLLETTLRARLNERLGGEIVTSIRTRVDLDPGRITGS